MKNLQGLSLGLAIVAIFLPRLIVLGSPLFSSEVWLINSFFFLVLFLAGYYLNRTLYLSLWAILLYFWADLYFLEFQNLSLFFLALIIFCLVIIGAILPAWLIPMATTVFSAFFIISSFFSPQSDFTITVPTSKQQSIDRPLPQFAYLHIILDEHGSPLSAWPNQKKNEHIGIFDEYLKAGFHVNALALSNTASTYESLGAIFGLSSKTDNFIFDHSDRSFDVSENRLVPLLYSMGFNIDVYQNNYLKLCLKSYLRHCETYRFGLNTQVIYNSKLSSTKRKKLIALVLHQDFFQQVWLYKFITNIFYSYGDIKSARSYDVFTRPIGGLQILDDVLTLGRNLKPGDALIAHILLPHSPYVFSRSCSIKQPKNWTYLMLDNPDGDFGKVYKGYWDQLLCAQSHINNFIKAIANRNDLVVIIHGDHGARIHGSSLRYWAPDDDLDMVGTFIASKGVGLSPGLFTKPVSLQETFINIVENRVAARAKPGHRPTEQSSTH